MMRVRMRLSEQATEGFEGSHFDGSEGVISARTSSLSTQDPDHVEAFSINQDRGQDSLVTRSSGLETARQIQKDGGINA